MQKHLRLLLIAVVMALLISTPETFAQDDTGIITEAVLHDSRDALYRIPGGAMPWRSAVTLRLRTAAGDIDEVGLNVLNTRDGVVSLVPMTVASTTPDGYDIWAATIDVGRKATVLWYRFILTKNGQTLFYEDDTLLESETFFEPNEGGIGTLNAQASNQGFQIAVYDPDFYTPEWFRSSIVYQVFPDRFRNGDVLNDPVGGSEVFYGEIPLYFHTTWNEPMLDGRVDRLPNGNGYWNSDFYGGDLAGIIEKLDYLQELGVTAIYLNPVFAARSNHRYDTADYKMIDPMLGTLDDFRALVAEADTRGIKIILDGVFNHLSSDSLFFDRYHRYETDGACESLETPYRAWFYFVPARASQPEPCVGENGNLYYVSWAGFDSIPQVNSNILETRQYFFLDPDSVVQTWGNEGISGWRLDAAEQIDDGVSPANIYWEAFRTVVRRVNPEAVIIGEFWHDAAEWLLGDEWDSTMNYRFRRGIIGFVRGSDYEDGDGLIPGLTPSQFDDLVRAVAEDYPPMAFHALLNLLDSHDTSRILFAVDNDKRVMKLAVLTLYTLPGVPMVYYGDEIALDAPSIFDGSAFQDDPYNRAPYPWPDASGDYYAAPDEDMLAFYQKLGAMRHGNPALREGEMLTLVTDDQHGVYAFLRRDVTASNAALVVLNTGDDDREVAIDLTGVLPTGLTLTSVLGHNAINTDDQSFTVRVDAKSGDAWTVSAPVGSLSPLNAPANVQAAGMTGKVTLSWDVVDGAAGYVVYRSPVGSGGFEPVISAPVSETTYADDTVSNGFVYYYAVAPVAENGLIGDISEAALAVPSVEVGSVFYVDASPISAMGLVVGAQARLQAAITVDDVTDAEGQAAGIRAQAALIPVGVAVEDADWLPIAYAGEMVGADLYEAVFEPQTIGEFQMAARFSVNAGLDWVIVTLEDGTLPLLKVEPSDDTEPPEAPSAVAITRASLSGVGLSWEAVADPNLFAYRIYRTEAGGEAKLLVELPSEVLAFLDAGVVDGQTYTYAVAAVDGSLNESPATATEPVLVERQSLPVTFVAEVPDYTDSAVYIAGDFGTGAYPTWDPVGEGMMMTQVDDTHWAITLELPEGVRIQYKFVRSTWEAVEKGESCEEIANRRLTITYDSLGDLSNEFVETGSFIARSVIAKWRDLDGCG